MTQQDEGGAGPGHDPSKEGQPAGGHLPVAPEHSDAGQKSSTGGQAEAKTAEIKKADVQKRIDEWHSFMATPSSREHHANLDELDDAFHELHNWIKAANQAAIPAGHPLANTFNKFEHEILRSKEIEATLATAAIPPPQTLVSGDVSARNELLKTLRYVLVASVAVWVVYLLYLAQSREKTSGQAEASKKDVQTAASACIKAETTLRETSSSVGASLQGMSRISDSCMDLSREIRVSSENCSSPKSQYCLMNAIKAAGKDEAWVKFREKLSKCTKDNLSRCDCTLDTQAHLSRSLRGARSMEIVSQTAATIAIIIVAITLVLSTLNLTRGIVKAADAKTQPLERAKNRYDAFKQSLTIMAFGLASLSAFVTLYGPLGINRADILVKACGEGNASACYEYGINRLSQGQIAQARSALDYACDVFTRPGTHPPPDGLERGRACFWLAQTFREDDKATAFDEERRSLERACPDPSRFEDEELSSRLYDLACQELYVRFGSIDDQIEASFRARVEKVCELGSNIVCCGEGNIRDTCKPEPRSRFPRSAFASYTLGISTDLSKKNLGDDVPFKEPDPEKLGPAVDCTIGFLVSLKNDGAVPLQIKSLRLAVIEVPDGYSSSSVLPDGSVVVEDRSVSTLLGNLINNAYREASNRPLLAEDPIDRALPKPRLISWSTPTVSGGAGTSVELYTARHAFHVLTPAVREQSLQLSIDKDSGQELDPSLAPGRSTALDVSMIIRNRKPDARYAVHIYPTVTPATTAVPPPPDDALTSLRHICEAEKTEAKPACSATTAPAAKAK